MLQNRYTVPRISCPYFPVFRTSHCARPARATTTSPDSSGSQSPTRWWSRAAWNWQVTPDSLRTPAWYSIQTSVSTCHRSRHGGPVARAASCVALPRRERAPAASRRRVGGGTLCAQPCTRIDTADRWNAGGARYRAGSESVSRGVRDFDLIGRLQRPRGGRTQLAPTRWGINITPAVDPHGTCFIHSWRCTPLACWPWASGSPTPRCSGAPCSG